MISEFLQHGENNGIDSASLSHLTRMSERQVRHAVYVERQRGVPILSGNKGYFLPDMDSETGIAEIRKCYLAMTRGMESRRKICGALSKILNARTDGNEKL